MRSIIPAAAVALSALMPVLAAAQPSPDAAGMPCAQFLKARAGDALYRQASNWLYGYASGFIAGLQMARQQAGPGLTSDQLMKSVAAFCQANPGATIAAAASAWAPQPPPAAESPPPSRGPFLNLERPANPGGRR